MNTPTRNSIIRVIRVPLSLLIAVQCGGKPAEPRGPTPLLVIRPAPISMVAGTTVHLTASAFTPAGDPASCQPYRWISTDSSVARVNQNGDVTGLRDGQTTIRVTCEDAAATLTVESTVLAPAGYTVITDRSFSAKGLTRNDAVGAEGWDPGDEYQASLFSIVTDNTAPKSGPLVGQMRYPSGFPGGAQPAIIEKPIEGNYTSIYMSVWVKLSSAWFGHPSHVNKVVFMWMDGHPKFILSADGEGANPLKPAIRIQDSPDHTDTRLPNFMPGAVVTRGVWQRWEVIAQANTPGRADGRVRWWIDGLLVSDWRDIEFIEPSGNPRWQIFEWGPTWGGVGSVLAAEQFMWWDHVYVAGK